MRNQLNNKAEHVALPASVATLALAVALASATTKCPTRRGKAAKLEWPDR